MSSGKIAAEEQAEAEEHARAWGADTHRALAIGIGEALRCLERDDQQGLREAVLLIAAAAALVPDLQAALRAIEADGL